MQETSSRLAPVGGRRKTLRQRLARALGALTPREYGLASLSAVLLILAFPDFNLWPLAWVGLVPLAWTVVRRRQGMGAFLLGWLAGTLFFYGSCYWLTHAMIHFGGIPAWLAYPLLFPAALITGLFPALWSWVLARTSSSWGAGRALALAPFAWAATEWARLGVTGQLWNAVGYSQAYVPLLIQPARWGGVYAVSFLIAAVNAAVVYLILGRSASALLKSVAVGSAVCLIVIWSQPKGPEAASQPPEERVVAVAVQPDVPVVFGRSATETAALINRHLTLSEDALREWDGAHAQRIEDGSPPAVYNLPAEAQSDGAPSHVASARGREGGEWRGRELARVVIWPESPMNFAYTKDAAFREMVGRFARAHHAHVLFNSLEPAPAGGLYNSAVMVNEEGRLVAQYDKIRLLPFGEYVPLPRWLPAAWLLGGVVGDFTPGEKYPLMEVRGGERGLRIGVFICFESAFPVIARTFAREGADVLVNISNDGYLGRTPVMRQHLANTVLRAVETGRPVLRVTNTGISALVTPEGRVRDATEGFQSAVRTWTISRAVEGPTFYANYGDIFVWACALITLLSVASTLAVARRAPIN